MLAFYLRVSKASKDTEESNSIQSQRKLLRQSLSDYGLSKEKVMEYIDDGYSGKNFERPGIKRLFSDVEDGKIQVILVKDFSRFGRNYREVSEYLEKKFPEKGIRFIAVNNGYDRKPCCTVLQNVVREKDSNISDCVPKKRLYEESGICIFENILDDYYSKDNSSKIKQALLQRKKEGKYLAPFAPYGYKKDEKRGYLAVDKEAAEVVRLIFQMRCEGKSGGEIARYLNGKKIPSPLDYKNGRNGEHIWQSEVIWMILRNRVYLGNLVVGKYETVQIGGKRRRKVPSEQWIEIEAVHMAIIDQKTFESAQTTEKDLPKKEKKRAEVLPVSDLKGIVVCGGCRHKMKRKGQKSPRFFCKYYYYDRNPLCMRVGIKEEVLFQVIQEVLAENMNQFSRAYSYGQYQICYQKRFKSWKRKEEKLEKRRKTEQYFLYEKWKSGRICVEDYKKKAEEWKQKYKGIQKKREVVQELEESIFFAGLLREMLLEVLVDSFGNIRIRFRIKKE